MQDLTPGSVICFGSTIDGQFCLDKVLVIACADPWLPAEADRLDVGDAFAICTGGSITAGGTDAKADLTLYRGATVNNTVAGMFSFVPARPAHDEDARFARPAIPCRG